MSDDEGVDAMGRGRQKAKQTKVARALKYYSPQTDYARLQRELAGDSGKPADDDAYDEYAEFSDDGNDGDDSDGWSTSRR